jgi:hypothetical protein
VDHLIDAKGGRFRRAGSASGEVIFLLLVRRDFNAAREYNETAYGWFFDDLISRGSMTATEPSMGAR